MASTSDSWLLWLAGLALLLWRREDGTSSAPASGASTLPSSASASTPAAGYQWPMADVAGKHPIISSGWGEPRSIPVPHTHQGVDIVYAGGVPAGTLALAARAGHTKWAGVTSRGHGVILDHGDGWETFYQHLQDLAIPTTKGWPIAQGMPLGLVGADPANVAGGVHLHFELWYQGHAINPEPAMHAWPYIT